MTTCHNGMWIADSIPKNCLEIKHSLMRRVFEENGEVNPEKLLRNQAFFYEKSIWGEWNNQLIALSLARSVARSLRYQIQLKTSTRASLTETPSMVTAKSNAVQTWKLSVSTFIVESAALHCQIISSCSAAKSFDLVPLILTIFKFHFRFVLRS